MIDVPNGQLNMFGQRSRRWIATTGPWVSRIDDQAFEMEVPEHLAKLIKHFLANV
jgi:hypothetical protein